MKKELHDRLASVIDDLLADSTKTRGEHRYWYPLSRISFGREEILEIFDSLCAFRTTMGDKTSRFEQTFARYVGAEHAVMVNSGSSADLLLAFLLTNRRRPLLAPGDEVLVPAVTWPTQVWAPLMAGLSVRLVDVDPTTLNVCPASLVRNITPRTRAIFIVHLMGNPCEMDAIQQVAREHELILIEDACESLGACWDGRMVGTFGLGGTFSFFFSHHLTTMEGGMIVTSDGEAAEELRILRAHGWARDGKQDTRSADDPPVDSRYLFLNWGFNVRPTELQAAFGLQQIKKLPAFNEKRIQLADSFFRFIRSTPHLVAPSVSAKGQAVWMALPFLIAPNAPFSRDDLAQHLEKAGIETRPIVTGNLARQPAAKLFNLDRLDSLPGAEEIHRRGIYVGLSPSCDNSSLERMMTAIGEFVT